MRKFKVSAATLLLIFATAFFTDMTFAEDSPFGLKLTTDFAYYPKSKNVTGGTHFAPITGVYNSVEFRTTLKGSYQLDTPLGDHWLVKDANVSFGGGLELTPVSIRPMLSVEFEPLPFLNFAAGGSFGFGWNLLGIEGLCELNKDTGDYEKIVTFTHPYYKIWASATFQFDTGAIFPGDWTHVVMLASYTTSYSGIAGLDSDSIYEWQNSKGKVRGLSYEFQGVLGYQMPLVLRLAGVMFTVEGFYDGSVYGEYAENYDGDFATVCISPITRFKFGAKDELVCLLDFSSRRSFDAEFTKNSESFLLNTVGREWYFKRIALSWTHRFV